MKILFLLFPLILLLVRGAAGERGRGEKGGKCERQGGFCSRRSCPFGTRFAGICAGEYVCCKR
uniref:Beta-defensin-like domain-containing protein n=1 Tax=Geospiza parvula TaxID=87175 RepID=A0A8C3N0Z1_GEOPR